MIIIIGFQKTGGELYGVEIQVSVGLGILLFLHARSQVGHLYFGIDR
jgi:hypothetical protein